MVNVVATLFRPDKRYVAEARIGRPPEKALDISDLLSMGANTVAPAPLVEKPMEHTELSQGLLIDAVRITIACPVLGVTVTTGPASSNSHAELFAPSLLSDAAAVLVPKLEKSAVPAGPCGP